MPLKVEFSSHQDWIQLGRGAEMLTQVSSGWMGQNLGVELGW